MAPISQDLTFWITPCPVSSIIDFETVGDITYIIGNPDQTQGTYSFQDSPNACGYDQTIDVTGVPAFVIHDDVSREFTVLETLDQSLIGSYAVAIDVKIQVPTDYTKSTFTEHTHRTYVMIYVEPC